MREVADYYDFRVYGLGRTRAERGWVVSESPLRVEINGAVAEIPGVDGPRPVGIVFQREGDGWRLYGVRYRDTYCRAKLLCWAVDQHKVLSGQ